MDVSSLLFINDAASQIRSGTVFITSMVNAEVWVEILETGLEIIKVRPF